MRSLLALILIIFIPSPAFAEMTLDQYLAMYTTGQELKTVEVTDSELVLPFETLEYTFSRDDSLDMQSNEGTDIFRISFRSVSKMTATGKARRLERRLAKEIENHQINNRIYQQFHLALTELFAARNLDLISENRGLYKKYLDQIQNLSTTSDTASLKRLLDVQSKWELLQGSDSASATQMAIKKSDRALLIDQLLSRIESLSRQASGMQSRGLTNSLQRAELDLEKVDDELSGSLMSSGITHFEIRDSRNSSENTYRLGFSFPMDFFGDEDRRRKSLRVAKEVRLTVDEHLDRQKRDLVFSEIRDLSLHVSMLLARQRQLREILKNKRSSSSLLTSAHLLHFETENELLEKGQKFYDLFLDLIREHYFFSTHPNRNLLLPSAWEGV